MEHRSEYPIVRIPLMRSSIPPSLPGIPRKEGEGSDVPAFASPSNFPYLTI